MLCMSIDKSFLISHYIFLLKSLVVFCVGKNKLANPTETEFTDDKLSLLHTLLSHNCTLVVESMAVESEEEMVGVVVEVAEAAGVVAEVVEADKMVVGVVVEVAEVLADVVADVVMELQVAAAVAVAEVLAFFFFFLAGATLAICRGWSSR